MSLKGKRLVFFAIWFLILLTGPVTVIRNTPLTLKISDPVILANLFQRITGLLAFCLIFIQIMLGAFMGRWLQVIGARAYKLHTTQGLITYGFIFIHPLFENAIVYQVSGSLSKALLVFVPSLATQRDILLLFGRIAFILATIAVIAAYFRTKPFFRRNWRAFHILNYLVFYLVLVHSRIGTDIKTPPFVWVYWLAIISVSTTVIYKLFSPIFRRVILPVLSKQEQK